MGITSGFAKWLAKFGSKSASKRASKAVAKEIVEDTEKLATKTANKLYKNSSKNYINTSSKIAGSNLKDVGGSKKILFDDLDKVVKTSSDDIINIKGKKAMSQTQSNLFNKTKPMSERFTDGEKSLIRKAGIGAGIGATGLAIGATGVAVFDYYKQTNAISDSVRNQAEIIKNLEDLYDINKRYVNGLPVDESGNVDNENNPFELYKEQVEANKAGEQANAIEAVADSESSSTMWKSLATIAIVGTGGYIAYKLLNKKGKK